MTSETLSKRAYSPPTDPGLRSSDMTLTPPNSNRVVTINVASSEGMKSCAFWVSAFKFGTIPPSALFAMGTIDRVMYDIAADGLLEREPIMVADSRAHPVQFQYFMPFSQLKNEAAAGLKICTTIASWAPSSVGFYFAPEHFKAQECLSFLQQTVSEVVRTTLVSSIYLMPGKHGMNATLNAALKIKFSLESDHLRIKVFH